MEKVERLLYRFGNLKKQIKECKDEIKELFAEKYSCMEAVSYTHLCSSIKGSSEFIVFSLTADGMAFSIPPC